MPEPELSLLFVRRLNRLGTRYIVSGGVASILYGEPRLTNDVDFLTIHSRWQTAGRTHAGIVYWHQDKWPVGEAIRRIVDYAALTSPADAAKVVHYL